jgi:hypothetical protein
MSDKYPSKYSNGKQVSAAQFITEIICERKAQMNREDLHYRFWVHKAWASFYRNQIGSAHKLLKQFSAKAIIRALNTDTGRRIYSLRAPHLLDIIRKEEEILQSENTNFTLDINRKEDISYNKHQSKKNIISKLKDLDQ